MLIAYLYHPPDVGHVADVSVEVHVTPFSLQRTRGHGVDEGTASRVGPHHPLKEAIHCVARSLVNLNSPINRSARV